MSFSSRVPLVVLVALAIAGFAACGSSDNEDTSNVSTPESWQWTQGSTTVTVPVVEPK